MCASTPSTSLFREIDRLKWKLRKASRHIGDEAGGATELNGGGNGRAGRFAKKELPIRNSYCNPTGSVDGCVLGAETAEPLGDGGMVDEAGNGHGLGGSPLSPTMTLLAESRGGKVCMQRRR